MLSAAVVSGGLATRLRPLTATTPKSLLPINGEPFITHQLRLLRVNRIEHVVLCVGYLGEMFFVLYGDSYLPCDYGAVAAAFKATTKLALMTVFKNSDMWDASNVEFEDGKLIDYHKKRRSSRMHYIDYGLGVFRSEAFATVPSDRPADLAD